MKLQGNMFRHPMEYNTINIVSSDKGSYVMFHTTDGNMAYQAKYPINEFVDNMQFGLSNDDYKILAKLGDFDIAIDKDSLIVKADKFKARFARYESKQLELPKGSKPVQLNDITVADLRAASQFIRDKHVNRFLHGIIVSSSAIFGTDSHQMYRKKVDVKIDKGSISIPKEILKYLNDIDDYKLFLIGGKMICFAADNEVFYSNLYEGNFEANDVYFAHGTETIVCDKKEFTKSLKECSLFSKNVSLSGKDGNLKIESEINDKGSNYQAFLVCGYFVGEYKFNLEMLLNIIKISDCEELELFVGNKRGVIDCKGRAAVLMQTVKLDGGKQ